MTFDRDAIKLKAAELATHGVYIGTSSWKYPGWCGQLYEQDRYTWRGKFAESRFNRNCLSEYAEVFRTTCVDAAYYTFPSEKYLEGLATQVPQDFRFGFKVTDAITVHQFPDLERFGEMAGRQNPDFLNADLFATRFLLPCERIREKVGVLMFEFSRFHTHDYAHGRDFVADLDRFLSRLPTGWPYAIELRNRHWLQPEYFDCLSRHNVAHVFNSWTAMPPIEQQISLQNSITSPSLTAARFLLAPGRAYADAVKSFQPYTQTREVNAAARKAGATLIAAGKSDAKRKTFIFVNNRLEGNALATITAMIDQALAAQAAAETPGL